mgnify:CR=1 FL=1
MVRRYDPFRQMEAIFDDAMRQGPSRAAMPLDLYRDGEQFIALFDLPGVDPASVDIDIEDRTLTIRAERLAVAPEGAQWLSHERPFGTFARQLTLGNGVALDQVEAEYVTGCSSWLSRWQKKLNRAKLQYNAARGRLRARAKW